MPTPTVEPINSLYNVSPAEKSNIPFTYVSNEASLPLILPSAAIPSLHQKLSHINLLCSQEFISNCEAPSKYTRMKSLKPAPELGDHDAYPTSVSAYNCCCDRLIPSASVAFRTSLYFANAVSPPIVSTSSFSIYILHSSIVLLPLESNILFTYSFTLTDFSTPSAVRIIPSQSNLDSFAFQFKSEAPIVGIPTPSSNIL